MDGNYQSYVNRVVQMTLPANYKQQLKNIQSSPKFINGKPVDFPGFSIITPPSTEDNYNKNFYDSLRGFKYRLMEDLGHNFFLGLPSESFHLTLADLIWDKTYLNAVKENPNFDNILLSEVNKIFQEYQSFVTDAQSLELEVIGLSIFPRAIAVCLAPTESSYEPIVKLRQLIYQNEQIMKLGIEQHYDFAAHVTLGYFDKIDDNIDLAKVESIIKDVNDLWIENSANVFQLKQFELRKFTNMINYIRQPEWATITLN
ncbi:DUF1868 domain-containing protein [Geminocystis sp. GBBB08]|uniref:DUF1868 domain-containing protein n=1 Tax=Geminocystis sp. GBBB08 TaxID=2604140 RepID=UPI0027E2624A|nr:DUF1868 domain-containing protein [Geminocystis sp. GBBB08]MBL1210746.1 DUF1868 domain-containing protein [Geminocystis sp. GBBB08]